MSDFAAREAAARALYEEECRSDAEYRADPVGHATWQELGRKDARRDLANAAIDAYQAAAAGIGGALSTITIQLPAPSEQQVAAARKPLPKHLTEIERSTRLILRVWLSQPEGDPAITKAAADDLARILLPQLNPKITAEVEARLAAIQETPF